jgi:hypothetical protein
LARARAVPRPVRISTIRSIRKEAPAAMRRGARRGLLLCLVAACAGAAVADTERAADAAVADTERAADAAVADTERAADAAVADTERAALRSEERAPCSDFEPLRTAYFGDLHVHTSFSQDASTQGTRNGPRAAYRFARGEALGIQPYDEEGRAQRHVRLGRPLDFAAVTDHAELLGETHICLTADLPGHGSWVCRLYRAWPRAAFFLMNWRTSSRRDRFGFCGEDGRLCLEAAHGVWEEIRAAAEGAYDRTEACRFTSFVGYEWTGARDYYNLHRNVIFRNAVVPSLPTSFYEAHEPRELWAALERDCLAPPEGCDFLIIPHNANLSGGLMFESTGPDGRRRSDADLRTQARHERLVEVMQHKGDSECLLAAGGTDELCGFEQLPYDSFTGRFVPFLSNPPTEKSTVRHGLGLGLALEAQRGVNPFRFGLVASTDTHLGTPGLVDEKGHPGHGGAGKPARDALPEGLPDDAEFNPGGLVALWAEENARDALFDAMRRREAYGTSGPRLVVRFFGGWELDPDACERGDFVARGYARGVPMGGLLPPRPEAGSSGAPAPRFAVWALRDPGTEERPGTPLQRIQIVKGWVEGGAARERVFEVAGDPENGAGVDPATCTPHGPGFDHLCTVWSDPDFAPAQHAYYYARVVENPSCRWTTWACNEAGVRCEEPATVTSGFEPCCDAEVPKTIQERAWTSPIWYVPAGEGDAPRGSETDAARGKDTDAVGPAA